MHIFKVINMLNFIDIVMLTFNPLILMNLLTFKLILVLLIMLSNVYIIIHLFIHTIVDTKQLCYL